MNTLIDYYNGRATVEEIAETYNITIRNIKDVEYLLDQLGDWDNDISNDEVKEKHNELLEISKNWKIMN